MDIFCLADLETPNVEGGTYIIECVKYKNLFFIDDKTQLEVEDSHDIELIGIRGIIFHNTQIAFYFNNKEYVEPKLLKLLKFSKDGKEYELTLNFCYDSSQQDYVFYDDSWTKLEIGNYEVKYIIYNNEIMKPKNPLYFNYVTERSDIVEFPKKIKRKKRAEVSIRFYEKFNDLFEFYFREKDHSYILYKIYSEPYRKWESVPGVISLINIMEHSIQIMKILQKKHIKLEAYVIIITPIAIIITPKAIFGCDDYFICPKIEYVLQEVRKNTDFTFELIDQIKFIK